jgi:tRNA modification GTPase
MGVERSRKAAQQAQIIIAVIDASGLEPASEASRFNIGSILDNTRDKTGTITVLNKVDLLSPAVDLSSRLPFAYIPLSAKSGDIESLKKELVRIARSTMNTQAVMLSNARHYEAVSRAHEAIIRVQQGLHDGLSGELLSMDLQDCLNALGEVTGQITNTEVLSNIFSKFCIGK